MILAWVAFQVSQFAYEKYTCMHLYVNSLHVICVRKCFICFINAFRAYDLQQTVSILHVLVMNISQLGK